MLEKRRTSQTPKPQASADTVKRQQPRAKKSAISAIARTAGKRPKTATVLALIASDDHVTAGIVGLRKKCAFMRRAHDLTGHPPLRRNTGGFEGLVRIVNGQQLSVASASAIHARVVATLRPLSAETVIAASDETLRSCGLSRPKIKTLRALSAAVADGLDLEQVAVMDEPAAMAALTAVSGIGPWTAEIYLMFCVGRADVFASGDLALQIAAQMLMGLEQRPSAKQMAEIAERWRPHRAVAARLLWAYYAEAKKQGIAVPI